MTDAKAHEGASTCHCVSGEVDLNCDDLARTMDTTEATVDRWING